MFSIAILRTEKGVTILSGCFPKFVAGFVI